MAKHKTLQSVAQSFADAFTSTLNYTDNDYVMSHILRAARETGEKRLDVDILSGRIAPIQFLREPIAKPVAHYCAGFPNLVERNGSDPSFVVAAKMTLEFDVETELPMPQAPHKQSPFLCTVSLTDDRGRTYEAIRNDWW